MRPAAAVPATTTAISGYAFSDAESLRFLDAGDAASSSADAFFAFLFGTGLILFGLVAIAYAWYAFRCAKK